MYFFAQFGTKTPIDLLTMDGMSNIDAVYQQVPASLPTYVFSEFVDTPLLKARHGDASGVFGAAMLWD